MRLSRAGPSPKILGLIISGLSTSRETTTSVRRAPHLGQIHVRISGNYAVVGEQ
jgi:hypothetical protein